MADYHSPTVIQPDVPLADISPLERLLLTSMLEFEIEGAGIYLYAELSISASPEVRIGDLRAAYQESLGFESQVLPAVKVWIDNVSGAEDDEYADFDFDAHTDYSAYQLMLQDIVRRSSEVVYFTIEGAHTCTKMRPDGFGGWACLVHADGIEFQSTSGFLEMAISALKKPK